MNSYVDGGIIKRRVIIGPGEEEVPVIMNGQAVNTSGEFVVMGHSLGPYVKDLDSPILTANSRIVTLGVQSHTLILQLNIM